mgnify:CR=1 FL=1
MQTHTVGEWLTVIGTCSVATAALFAPVLALDHELPDWTAIAAKCQRGAQTVAIWITRVRIAVLEWLSQALLSHLSSLSAPKKGAL